MYRIAKSEPRKAIILIAKYHFMSIYPNDAVLEARGVRQLIKWRINDALTGTAPGMTQRQLVEGAAAGVDLIGVAAVWERRNVKDIVRDIGRAARAKSQGAERCKPGYEKLLELAEDLLQRARQVLQAVVFSATAAPAEDLLSGVADNRQQKLLHYLELTEKVCGTARRRVLLGETVPNEEKIFSIFEPHTELIKRGKQPNPIQYGHSVLVIEDAVGFVCHYEVLDKGVLDQDAVVPAMTKLQKRLHGQIERASFDRGFHTPANQKELAKIVAHPCLPKKGRATGRKQQEEASVEFREARQNHPGVESAIGALQAGNGQERCRDKSEDGFDRYVGLGILGRNLQVLGKLLLAQDEADCQAAKSKRKKATG